MLGEKDVPRYECVFRVARMVKGFSLYLTFSCVIRALAKVFQILLAYTAALLLVNAICGRTNGIATFGVTVLEMLVGVVLTSYLDTYVSHDMSFKILDQLRHKVYDRVDEIAPGGLEGRDVADLSLMLLSDINVFEWFYAHCLVEWIGTLLAVCAGLILLGAYSILSSVLLIPIFAFMMILPLLSIKQAEEKGLAGKRLNGRLSSIIADGIWGIKDVIGFHWTKTFYGKLKKTADEFGNSQLYYSKRAERERSLFAMVACTGVIISILIALYSGEGQATDVITVFALSTAAIGCIHDALSEGTNFGFVFGAAYRIVDVLDIPAPVVDTGLRTEKDVMDGQSCVISFRNVAFAYGGERDKEVLRDISFEAYPGEITAIVAASGGGKSTIARLLQRFWDVKSGSIRIGGVDIRELKLEALRNLITVVPQEVYLFNGTIADNLHMVRPDATDEKMKQASVRAQADEFIQRLEHGYDTQIGENGLMLSGGEKQRLALAQAFMKDAPVLVLDEATSALDTENEQKINLEIRNSGNSRTTIIIAHRLSSMMSADRIVFIKDGCVEQVGNYDFLLRENENFRELVRGEYLEQNDS